MLNSYDIKMVWLVVNWQGAALDWTLHDIVVHIVGDERVIDTKLLPANPKSGESALICSMFAMHASSNNLV